MRVRGDVGDGCVGSGQVFAVSDPAVKLKTWKTEKLTACPDCQDFRISGFQDFRFSEFQVFTPPPAARESDWGIPGGWSGDGKTIRVIL
jgi:hypothetical protein